jgi:hypothetical protein
MMANNAAWNSRVWYGIVWYVMVVLYHSEAHHDDWGVKAKVFTIMFLIQKNKPKQDISTCFSFFYS